MNNQTFCKISCGVAAAILGIGLPLSAVGPSFIPDSTFKGSSLSGLNTIGAVKWRADNGEIIGAGDGTGKGGWLVLNGSYQDVGFYTQFRCTGDCQAGVLLRTEKTPEGGLRGLYVSLTQGDLACYRLTLDANGQEVQKEKLRSAPMMIRIAPPPDPKAAEAEARMRAMFKPIPDPPDLPLTRPSGELIPNDWNRLEIVLDANIVHPHLNDAGNGIPSAADDEDANQYGPVALFVGGHGEVRFKDISLKDLSAKITAPESVSPHFRMQRINDFFYAWSASAADVNRDGIQDVVAGPYYYLGPDYSVAREIYLAQTFNPSNQYPDCMVNFAYDFTGDGWPDEICTSTGRPVTLYVNPRGENRLWDKHVVIPLVANEICLLKDIDGDGKPEFIYGVDGYIRYAKPDPANPTGPWIVHTISERGPWGAFGSHGLGVGDINGDGRPDILQAYGWWEQPPPDSKQELWTYHPEAFGRYGRIAPGGAEMAVYDVNGDGLNDVVTSLEGHGYGLAWFEQKRSADGKISFVRHMIMDDLWTKNAGGVTFSELHGATSADIDGDGIPDFIVGKRYWSHEDSYTDPDPYGPPVLYVFRTVRNPKAPGGAEFVPELIHNRSGVGSRISAVDLKGDGVMDILTSTDRGTFIFWNQWHKGTTTSARAR